MSMDGVPSSRRGRTASSPEWLDKSLRVEMQRSNLKAKIAHSQDPFLRKALEFELEELEQSAGVIESACYGTPITPRYKTASTPSFSSQSSPSHISGRLEEFSLPSGHADLLQSPRTRGRGLAG